MSKFLLLIVIVNFVFIQAFSAQENESGELLGVAVVFRHGDRVPIKFYPNDPYSNSSFWPAGLGQLTNKGKQQHYQLGKWLRNRYFDFLPEKYSENEIYVLSTDVDRTLMSAASNLAGLYPPKNDQIWNDQILWQPIPIHTKPQSEDAILAMSKKCPKYDQLLDELHKSDAFVQLQEENRELYEYLSNSTGQNISTLTDIEYLQNILYIEKLYNYTLPEWTQSVYPEPLTKLSGISFGVGSYTSDMARLKSGPFLHQLLNQFQNFRVNDSTPTFLMYSAHDTTIANLLSSLKAFDHVQPKYASTLIFELRRSGEGKDFVNVLYKRSETLVENVTVDGCAFDCELDEFEEILSDVTVSLEDWEKECLDISNKLL